MENRPLSEKRTLHFKSEQDPRYHHWKSLDDVKEAVQQSFRDIKGILISDKEIELIRAIFIQRFGKELIE
jgi:hypothetical protein